MRFRLRTLLIVLALGPMILAVTYWGVKEWQRRQAVARQLNAYPVGDLVIPTPAPP